MNDSADNLLHEDIQDAINEWKKGDNLMLFEAIRRCGQYGVLLPPELTQALAEGIRKYDVGFEKDFGDAFGVTRPKGFYLNAYKKKNHLPYQVKKRVAELQGNGESIDDQLFEIIGREFGISKTTASNYYYNY